MKKLWGIMFSIACATTFQSAMVYLFCSASAKSLSWDRWGTYEVGWWAALSIIGFVAAWIGVVYSSYHWGKKE